MPQLDGKAVDCNADAQWPTIVASFPMRFVLMAIGEQRSQVVEMALQIGIAFRADDVVDLRRDLDDAAQFAVLAKRPSAQGSRAGDLAPVSRAVIGAIGIDCAVIAGSHVDLPVARVVRAIGAG
jgi:hypothetical protein